MILHQNGARMSVNKVTAKPNSRNSDPVSSVIAGELAESSGLAHNQRLQATAAVKEHPGSTSKELAYLTGLDRFMLARRLHECIGVKRGDARQCRVGGRLSLTWWPIY